MAISAQVNRASEDDFFVFDSFGGRTLNLNAQLALFMGRIKGMKTLEEHASSAAASGWGGGDFSLAHDAVTALAGMHLLIPESEVARRIVELRPHESPPERISALAWPTKDRVEVLLRGMRSFLSNTRAHGRSVIPVVVNDSIDLIAEPRMIAALTEFAREAGAPVNYAGFTEKNDFITVLLRRLAPAGCPPETIRFAISDMLSCGPTFGANRNASILATLGRMFLSADDDMVCLPARSPEYSNRLEIIEVPEPGNLRFFQTREELLNSVGTGTVDILSVNEELLGRDVSSIARPHAAKNELGIYVEPGNMLNALMTGKARVRTTVGGTYGDSGMGTPRLHLTLKGANRKRLVSSEEGYHAAFASRELFLVFPCNTISPGPFIPGMNIGLDNRDILPPFMPVLRGEDFIFAYTVRACFTDCAIGYIPWALAHFPEGGRSFSEGAAFQNAPFFSEQAFIAIHSFNPSPGINSPRDRMRALGSHLQSIASLDDADYESFMKSRWIAQASYRIGLMENSLMEHDYKPSFWARDLERAIRSMEEFALNGEASVPSDLLHGRTPAEARALGKKILGMYGELLYWWPSIVDAARAMKDEGIEITRELSR